MEAIALARRSFECGIVQRVRFHCTNQVADAFQIVYFSQSLGKLLLRQNKGVSRLTVVVEGVGNRLERFTRFVHICAVGQYGDGGRGRHAAYTADDSE